jgi:hypothetical protein
MFNKMTSLAKQIEESFSGSTTEVEIFSSGSAMLEVRRQGRLFVMAYLSSGDFGVDEVGKDEGFETGYRMVSNKFDEAAEELYRLLHAAEE